MKQMRSDLFVCSAGGICVGLAYCLLCIILIAWHMNGDEGRKICRVAGPVAGVLSMLAICSGAWILRKRRRTGLAVLGFGLAALLLVLCIPKL